MKFDAEAALAAALDGEGGISHWRRPVDPARGLYYLMPPQPPPRFWLDPALSGRPAEEGARLTEIVGKIDRDITLTEAEFFEYMKLRGFADLFFYAKNLCGLDWLAADLHGPLAWAWQAPDGWTTEWGQVYDRYRLGVIARGHLKTSLLTVISASWDAIRDVEERLLIYTHGLEFTAEVMGPIKDLFEGQGKGAAAYLRCYGDLIPEPGERGKKYKWDQLHLTLKRQGRYTDPTIKGGAVGAKITGTHSTKQYIDDLVGEDLSRTRMNKVFNAIENLQFCYASMGLSRRRMVGTPWAFSDPITYAQKVWPNALVARLPWRRPNGDLLFDKSDVPEALRIKKMNPWFFSCQYDVVPKSEDGGGFQRAWFRYFTREDKHIVVRDDADKVVRRVALADCNIFILIDPNTGREPGERVTADANAPKAKKRDFAGWITVAVDRDRNWYVLSAIRRRCNPSELIDLTFQLVGIWSPVKVCIEQRAAQILFVQLFLNAFKEGKPPFVIDDFEGGHMSKEERIKGLIPLYANGKIYHREFSPNRIDEQIAEGTVSLEQELEDFPSAEWDDLSDALSAGLKKVYPPGANAPTEESAHRETRFEETISHLDKASRRAARGWKDRLVAKADEFWFEG